MKIDLTIQEIRILLAWSEEATKGKFSLGDESVGFTWEEGVLLDKLQNALKKTKES